MKPFFMNFTCNFNFVIGNFSQGRQNGLEHGGDSEPPITFQPFMVQTSNLQFWKW